jgi:hypothetical protein
MKKQKVSLQKLHLSKSKVSNLTTNQIVGGSFLCVTTNCILTTDCDPLTSDCPVPTSDCPSINCLTLDCLTLAGCTTNNPTMNC